MLHRILWGICFIGNIDLGRFYEELGKPKDVVVASKMLQPGSVEQLNYHSGSILKLFFPSSIVSTIDTRSTERGNQLCAKWFSQLHLSFNCFQRSSKLPSRIQSEVFLHQ